MLGPDDTVIDKTDLEGTRSPANAVEVTCGLVARDSMVRKAREGGQSRGSRERPEDTVSLLETPGETFLGWVHP